MKGPKLVIEISLKEILEDIRNQIRVDQSYKKDAKDMEHRINYYLDLIEKDNIKLEG